MVAKPEVLAIIPARGGSKGIPRKNIRNFARYPLIAYSIQAAKTASLVSRVVVSTDDEEIAAVAHEYGAETPFLRPIKLAQDQITDFPVFEHALAWLKENEGYEPEIVVQLRPTSPIRPAGCVDEAIQLLLDHPEVDSVRGVVPSKQNPFKMWKIDEKSGQMEPLLTMNGITEAFNAPRQILPATFWQTGHIDAIRTSTIINKKSMSGNRILPLIINPAYAIDIDSLLDWQQAEWFMMNSDLNMVDPASKRRKLPATVDLLVLDFDGVLTDNRVWVDEKGHERVAASRSDSFGLSLLSRETQIQIMVISRETNPVVAARCDKLGLPFLQGIKEKDVALKAVVAAKRLDFENVIYMGNDLADMPCFSLVACAVAPADAEKEILRAADIVLAKNGGHGAVRELCGMLLANYKNKSVSATDTL